MAGELNRIYCQNCRALNSLARELCAKCGTRLMLVVNTAVARHEESGSKTIHQEHLLERISILENNLSKLVEKVGETVDLLLKQARSSYLDHMLLETLIHLLGEAKQVDFEQLHELWEQKCQEGLEGRSADERLGRFEREVLEAYRGAQRERFASYLHQGFQLITDGKLKDGIKSLERAALLDPENFRLNYNLGRILFARRRFKTAYKYLARAYQRDSRNPHLALLYGLTNVEKGKDEEAATLLRYTLRKLGPVFSAHYALGRLHADADRWPQALAEFKKALAARPTGEILFLAGLASFMSGQPSAARRYLERAETGETSGGDVPFILGLALWRLKETEAAREAFIRAARREPQNPLFRAAAAGQVPRGISPIQSFIKTKILPPQTLTGGLKSLTDELIEDALSVTGEE